MRRTTAVRSVLAGALVLTIGLGGLAACSNGGSKSAATASSSATSAATDAPTAPPTASAADVAAVGKITVTGAAGAKPTITLPAKPFTVGGTVVRTISDGTGAALADGAVVQFNSLAVKGADGTEGSSSYGAAPETVALSSTSLNPDLYKALVSAHIGARVLLAVPSSSNGTVVGVIDVIGTVPSRATGTPVTPPAGLPTVTLGSDGAPTLKPAGGAAPTSLVVQPLIQGSGATVANGQSITVQYTGWLWDGTEFDSSWTKGTPLSGLTIGQNQVIKGWDQGLVGQKVGSQVLLVVPPALGYADKAQGSIPANSTLVFVVDILAAG